MRIRDAARDRLGTVLTTAVAAAAIGAAGACGTPTSTPPPDPNSCAGQTIDRSAPVIGGGDVVVPAPVRDVWAAHTAIESYPQWKAGVTYARRLDPGPVRVGSTFRWDNGGMPIVSTVRAVVPERCTLWGGPSRGIDGVHLWTFTPVPGGTLVHTEESWTGSPVEAQPAAAKALLDKAMAAGLADIKTHVAPGS